MTERRRIVRTPNQMGPRASVLRLTYISGLAGGIGLVAGGAAWVLVHLIGFLTNVALFHRRGTGLPSMRELHPGAPLFVAAVAGALVVATLARWSPVIKGHGIPEAMEAILLRQSRISPRAALAKPLSAAVAIGTGGPFGAEGPIIVTGGALGSLIGQVLPVSPAERKVLLSAGAAAGMSATFGAPLAAVVLAIELLLFEFSTRSFIPLVVASSVAGGVHVAVFGSGPLFHVPAHDFAGLGRLPLYAVVGVACGVLALVINKVLFLLESAFRRLPVNDFFHPAIGAVGFATVGLFVPRALGVGYDAIDDVLARRLAVSTLIVLGIAKLVAWWLALASGTSGGTLAPILLISGCYGALLGEAADRLFPNAHVSPGAFALVAMAATFGSTTRAAFTSIVFVFELTRDYQAILPVMLATVLADLVVLGFMKETLMTEKLARRGLRVHLEYEADVLRGTLVREVMTPDVETLPIDASLDVALRRFERGGHGAYPVVGADGALVGIVARGDVLREERIEEEAAGGASVGDVASTDVVTIRPGEPVIAALRSMLEEEIEHVPVVDGGRMVGICTRSDILRARRRQFTHDVLEPGWRLSRLRPRRRP